MSYAIIKVLFEIKFDLVSNGYIDEDIYIGNCNILVRVLDHISSKCQLRTVCLVTPTDH